MTKSPRGKRIALAVGLALTAAAFFVHERLVDRRIEPPGAGRALSEFAKLAEPPIRLAVVERDGERRLVWVGPVPRFTVRSGPPCYVFDRGGRLEAWTPATGEKGPLDPFKAAAYEAEPISLDEALRWCRQGASAPASSGERASGAIFDFVEPASSRKIKIDCPAL